MPKGAKTKKDVEKTEKFMDHGTVVLNTINQKVNVHNTIYSWRIPKYLKLKRGVMYFQLFESADIKCVFKLFKTTKTLYLCLRCGQVANRKAQFYVISETARISLSVEAKEIKEGVFTGQFKYEEFEGTDLPYILHGMLTVSFRYISDSATDYKESEFDGVDVLADLDELCCDLKKMYLESMYPDFIIHAGEYEFKAHKFILAARCPAFQTFFAENPDHQDIKLDTIPGILHEVLLYVYCGELTEMNLTCMMKVMDLASHLQIKSLMDKCAEYFVKHVDRESFKDFNTFQREKHPSLEEVVKKILTKLQDEAKRTTQASA